MKLFVSYWFLDTQDNVFVPGRIFVTIEETTITQGVIERLEILIAARRAHLGLAYILNVQQIGEG